MARDQISESRLNDIAELAEVVAEEHGESLRTEPQKIIGANRITVSFGGYGEAFDGMLEHRRGRFHIYANLNRLKTPDSGRARFTLAHELGHFYIDEHRRELQSGRAPSHPSRTDFQSKNPVEQEADHFASHLLMPTARFKKAANGLGVGLSAVLSLKDRFGTSITSTAIRYTKLDLAPCAIVKWNPDGYAWKWFSPSMYNAGYRATIKTLEAVLPDSATGRALVGEPGGLKQYFESGTSGSAWFPGIFPGSARDQIFIEQAVSLGEFGVLTLLYPERKAI